MEQGGVWSYGMGRRIANLQNRLQMLELRQTSSTTKEEIQEARRNLNIWLVAESTMWKQRSRNTRLVCGNCNTGFFHAKDFNRFQRNSIHGLCDETSAWQDDDKVLERIVVDYFHSIFWTNGQSETANVITTIQPVVSMSMNEALIMEFRAEEVAKALKQMH